MLERRSAERFQILAAVSCSVAGRSEQAVAYDLSSDGCMIEAPRGFCQPGDDIALTFPGIASATGKVIWTKHRNAGLQFTTPITSAQVADICRKCASPAPACENGAHNQTAAELRSAYRLRSEPYSSAQLIAPEVASRQKLTLFQAGSLFAGLILYCAFLLLAN
jgi:hypothetical protein